MKRSFAAHQRCAAAIAGAALAVALVGTTAVPSALAYFTTYVEAQGGYTVELEDIDTKPEESMTEWVKHVTVKNSEKSEACFVRAKAFAGSTYQLSFSGDSWGVGDEGWYYYLQPVEPGGTTDPLDVSIQFATTADSKRDFNVTVVYETVPAGDVANVFDADWDAPLDTDTAVYNSGEEA